VLPATTVAVFSLNVPLPPAVDRLAAALEAAVDDGEHRTRHTLVCKRVSAVEHAETRAETRAETSAAALETLQNRLEPVRAAAEPFELALTGVDAFEARPAATDTVVYLTVESPGLMRLHRRLCAVFEPVDGIEADAYVPHVTLSRGSDPSEVRAALAAEAQSLPVRWRAHELEVYDAAFREVAATVSL